MAIPGMFFCRFDHSPNSFGRKMGSNGILAFGASLPNRRRKANLGPTNGTNTPPGRDLIVKT